MRPNKPRDFSRTWAARVADGAIGFHVEYQLNACQGKPAERVRILALHARIQDQFNEHGVQIMSPHYKADKPHAVVVPKDQWFKTPATEPLSNRASA